MRRTSGTSEPACETRRKVDTMIPCPWRDTWPREMEREKETLRSL